MQIPGTNHLQDIAIDGNQALVLGSTGGLSFNGNSSFPGSLVLATLDITNPTNPTLISTQTLSRGFDGQNNGWPGALASLGNDLYVASCPGTGTDSTALLLIDAQNPSDIQVVPYDVPNAPFGEQASGNLLYTVDPTGLVIYNIAPVLSVPITAQVKVPTNSGVSIASNSFSVPPTSITPNGNNTETIEWDLNLPAGNGSQTITWQSDVTGLQPGQSLTVDQSGTVQFTDQVSPGTLTLPAQYVSGEQIVGLSPPTQTVAPAAAASYDVTLLNPTSSPVTYDLSVLGVPANWVNFPTSVTVAANGSADLPLVLMSDPFAALGDYGFTVAASGNNGSMASVEGDLVLEGQAVTPDPNSHGIVAALTPSTVTAGQATSAQYVVQLTNTGSADDTFSLAATGLPSSVMASFGESSVDVPPGVSNFRDIPLELSVKQGTTSGSYPFTVTATSTTDPAVTNTTNGTLVVTAGGVKVTLNPSSGAPGTSFQATVTNTGTVTDTYTLALAGPAALVSNLNSTSVTLSPGASQNVPITTGAVNFAVQGSLPLIAMATSTTNPAIQGAAYFESDHRSSQGMTAEFTPSSETLLHPWNGHIPLDGSQHREHRRFLFRHHHGRTRTDHRHLGRPRRLADAIDPYLHSAGLIDRGDRASRPTSRLRGSR